MMIDLHIHTTASDGSLTPTQVVKEAAGKKLTAIAVTDHDTVNGVDEALRAGIEYGVAVVPGVEFGTDYMGRETHILGYFNAEGFHGIKGYFDWILEKRHERNRQLVANLNKAGYEVTVDDMYAKAAGGTPGRPHLAKCLIEKGYAEDISGAFEKILLRKDIFVPREKTAPESVIAEILDKKGIPVLAHPVYMENDGIFEKGIREFMGMGLLGIEVAHSDHSMADIARYIRFAEDNGLIMTGGSDYHGKNKDDVFIGVPKTPDRYYEVLAAALQNGV